MFQFFFFVIIKTLLYTAFILSSLPFFSIVNKMISELITTSIIFLVLSASLSDGQNISNEGSDMSSTLVSTTMSAVETSTIDEDYDSEKSSTSETQDTKQPPLVFPSDDEKTETSKNETALEILQKNSNASTMENRVISEEVILIRYLIIIQFIFK